MQSQHPSAIRQRPSRGFTLIELMIGMLIGLLASLAVAHVLHESEGQKRAAASGSDAQVNGALALATLRRSVQDAGYGFTQVPGLIGCELKSSYAGSAVAGLAGALVPVLITNGGAAGEPDSIRVLASGKTSFSIPLRISNVYSPGSSTTGQQFYVLSTLGVESPTATYPGDLMVAGKDATQECEIFRSTGIVAPFVVGRADDASGWNSAGFPAKSYDDGNFLVNLGSPVDVTYSVGNQSMVATSLRLSPTGAPSYEGPSPLFANIVNLQALYGKDTNPVPDGAIDVWDSLTPTTNTGWQQVVAVRVAVVARSAQFEKEEVTAVAPEWNVGTAQAVTGATTCGASRCLPLKVDNVSDWKHYRYKVFETIVPLRNMLWRPV